MMGPVTLETECERLEREAREYVRDLNADKRFPRLMKRHELPEFVVAGNPSNSECAGPRECVPLKMVKK